MSTPVPNTTPVLGQDIAALDSPSANLQALLGPPPIIYGETKDAYDAFFARVQASVRPKDIFEEIWVRDVVDLVWWAQRLRRLRDSLLVATTKDAITAVMRPPRLRSSSLLGLSRRFSDQQGIIRKKPQMSIPSALL